MRIKGREEDGSYSIGYASLPCRLSAGSSTYLLTLTSSDSGSNNNSTWREDTNAPGKEMVATKYIHIRYWVEANAARTASPVGIGI